MENDRGEDVDGWLGSRAVWSIYVDGWLGSRAVWSIYVDGWLGSWAVWSIYVDVIYTLSLQTRNNLSEVNTDGAVASTAALLESHMDACTVALRERLTERNVNEGIVDAVPMNPFLREFTSSKQRMQQVKQSLPVLPDYLGNDRRPSRSFDWKAYIVPMRESLKRRLEVPQVWQRQIL